MSPELFRTFMVSALIALPLVVYLVRRLRAKQAARLRHSAWMKLCRRLELRPREGEPRVLSGRQQGAEIELRDTGSALHLGMRLPRPLLPPGVLLLPAQAEELSSDAALRPLRLRDRSAPPGTLGWYASPEASAGDVEVSQAFLDEVEHAARVHPALRVAPEWLFQSLPAASLPDPRELRDVVQALQRTVERWLQVVEAHGLPRLEAPPPAQLAHVHVFAPASPARLPAQSPLPPFARFPAQPPPPFSRRLLHSLARRDPWLWLLCINGGTPLAVISLRLQSDGLWLAAMISYFVGVLYFGSRRFKTGGAFLAMLSLPASFVAPAQWLESAELRNEPCAEKISVREAPRYPDARCYRFQDGTLRRDLVGRVTVNEKERKGTVRRTYRAYPVVPEGWTLEEPVTVWSITNPPLSRSGPKVEGFRGSISSRVRQAAAAAAREHGLINHPQAVYLDLSHSVQKELELMENQAVVLWALPNLIWWVAALVFWGDELLRRSRASGGPSQAR